MTHKIRYPRILLKLSGEALLGSLNYGIDANAIAFVIDQISEVVELGVQIAIVIGAGNLFRGKTLSQIGIDAVNADHIGMLATVINAMVLRDTLIQRNIPTCLQSSFSVSGFIPIFNRFEALSALASKKVVIFAGGTGNPLVTTDSAASLRSIEINADLLIKATKVSGVYSEDPHQNPNAQLYQQLSYEEVLTKELGVMDLSAFCQCRDYKIPIRVCNIFKPHVLRQIVLGEEEGTLVS